MQPDVQNNCFSDRIMVVAGAATAAAEIAVAGRGCSCRGLLFFFLLVVVMGATPVVVVAAAVVALLSITLAVVVLSRLLTQSSLRVTQPWLSLDFTAKPLSSDPQLFQY